MKKLLILILTLVLLGTGCQTICPKATPENLSQAQAYLKLLQKGYDDALIIMQKNPDPQVRVWFAMTDLALHLVGTMVATGCADNRAIALAENALQNRGKL